MRRGINNMNETINEDLEILMIDRINKAFKKSEEYKEAVSAENDIYEELKTKISEQNQNLLEKYVELSSETKAVCEKVSYIQGIRDCVQFLFQD